MRRVEVKYIGRVQNVGFRYTVHQCAQSFQVTGFVRNEADGTVFLVAEGPESELKSFLEMIAERMTDYIRDTQLHWSAASGSYASFEIQR